MTFQGPDQPGDIEYSAEFHASQHHPEGLDPLDGYATDDELEAAIAALEAEDATKVGSVVLHYYTANNTWTKPAGLLWVEVEVQAPGGGGGGADEGAGGNAAGGGAGAGEYGRKKILAAALGATETVTVPAGAAGGSTVGGNGATGSTASFGSHITAVGGTGGQGATGAGAGGSGESGGTGGTGGDFYIPGQNGFPPQTNGADNLTGGDGGDSHLGHGGAFRLIADTDHTGASGFNYGGGGGGAIVNSATGRAGGPGAPAIIIVKEYIA